MHFLWRARKFAGSAAYSYIQYIALHKNCMEKFPVLNTALILHIGRNVRDYVENQGSV